MNRRDFGFTLLGGSFAGGFAVRLLSGPPVKNGASDDVVKGHVHGDWYDSLAEVRSPPRGRYLFTHSHPVGSSGLHNHGLAHWHPTDRVIEQCTS